MTLSDSPQKSKSPSTQVEVNQTSDETPITEDPNQKFFRMSRVFQIMQDILDLVPVNDEYSVARGRLKYQIESIPYTAPETLGNCWLELYDWLVRYMPDTRETGEVKLSWAKQIEKIWRSAINNQKSLLTDKANLLM